MQGRSISTMACAAMALVSTSATTGAFAAPKELLGKSVVVTWTETAVQRPVGTPNFRTVNISQQFSAYVSSAGRVFAKLQVSSRRGTGAREQIAGQGGSRWVPNFSGRTMIVVQPQDGMARRISVTFDAGFSSCTASVIRGKSGSGSGFVKSSPVTGQRLEVQSVSTSGASCSVKDGNVFGGN